jgi:hypothetical protein
MTCTQAGRHGHVSIEYVYWLCCIYTGPRYTKYTLPSWSINSIFIGAKCGAVQNEGLEVLRTFVLSVAREN